MTFAILFLVAALALPVLINAVVHLDRRKVLRGTCEGNDPLPWTVAIRAFLVECAALTSLLGARTFSAIVRRPAVGRDADHLVILVAGYGLHASAFWLLERRLRLLGFDTAVVSHRSCRVPIDQAAANLGERFIRTREASLHGVVSVLAFGCTGLLVRRWLRDEPAETVQQVITLGTPHQGTLGLLSRFKPFRFARPSSSFLRELAEQDPVPRRFEPIAISSELDAWIVPNDAAYYPGAFNIAVRDIGHFTLLFSQRIVELVAENLKTASAAQRARPSTASSTRATSSASL